MNTTGPHSRRRYPVAVAVAFLDMPLFPRVLSFMARYRDARSGKWLSRYASFSMFSYVPVQCSAAVLLVVYP